MNQIKKHAIGYNTVSSVDGVISARSVKSYQNNLEIYGYTHEIGEGEKSPDNPYILQSLDSGAISVDGVDYEHSIVLSNNDMSIQVPVPTSLNSVEGVSDYIFKDGDGIWKLMQMCEKHYFSKKESIYIQSVNSYGIVNFVYELKKPSTRDTKSICSHYINQRTLIDDTLSTGYMLGNKDSTNSTVVFFRISNEILSTVSELQNFFLDEYNANRPATVIYKLRNQIVHTLSDYTQDLLNSFTLQSNNKIWVEGNPDIKVSGYILK